MQRVGVWIKGEGGENGRWVGLFLFREAMMAYLSQLYDKAEAGDVIWGQCVRFTNFNRDVRTKILEAVGKSAPFEMIIYQHAPALPEFEALFVPIKSVNVVAAPDNALPMQGFLNKEVGDYLCRDGELNGRCDS